MQIVRLESDPIGPTRGPLPVPAAPSARLPRRRRRREEEEDREREREQERDPETPGSEEPGDGDGEKHVDVRVRPHRGLVAGGADGRIFPLDRPAVLQNETAPLLVGTQPCAALRGDGSRRNLRPDGARRKRKERAHILLN